MRKGFLLYEEMRKYLTIHEEAYMTLQLLHSEFPFISFLSVKNPDGSVFEREASSKFVLGYSVCTAGCSTGYRRGNEIRKHMK